MQKADLLQDRFNSWVVKRTTSLFNSFCSTIANKVARFFPVIPYLYETASFNLGAKGLKY